MKKLSFLLMLFFPWPALSGELPVEVEELCLIEEEVKLYEKINAYREQKGKDPIPLSFNLTIVAQAHAIDLFENKPYDDHCNMHSWSDNGPWSQCCYTSDHSNPHCMWDKPGEVSNYPGRGYEIVYSYWPVSSSVPLAKEALEAWQLSPGHNNTIINAGVFTQATWNAMGVGIYGGYVVVWFGEEADPDGPPPFCED